MDLTAEENGAASAAAATPPSKRPRAPDALRVTLLGLVAKPELNGRSGVLEGWDEELSGRYKVRLDQPVDGQWFVAPKPACVVLPAGTVVRLAGRRATVRSHDASASNDDGSLGRYVLDVREQDRMKEVMARRDEVTLPRSLGGSGSQ